MFIKNNKMFSKQVRYIVENLNSDTYSIVISTLHENKIYIELFQNKIK